MQVWIAIGVGLLIGIVLLFILTRRRFGVVSRRVVLLLGPSDAGKTSLFSQLVHGRSVDTYTSMVENSTTKSFSTGNGASSKSVQLVDLPGHERLRVAGLEVRQFEIIILLKSRLSDNCPQSGLKIWFFLCESFVINRFTVQ